MERLFNNYIKAWEENNLAKIKEYFDKFNSLGLWFFRGLAIQLGLLLYILFAVVKVGLWLLDFFLFAPVPRNRAEWPLNDKNLY